MQAEANRYEACRRKTTNMQDCVIYLHCSITMFYYIMNSQNHAESADFQFGFKSKYRYRSWLCVTPYYLALCRWPCGFHRLLSSCNPTKPRPLHHPPMFGHIQTLFPAPLLKPLLHPVSVQLRVLSFPLTQQ